MTNINLKYQLINKSTKEICKVFSSVEEAIEYQVKVIRECLDNYKNKNCELYNFEIITIEE